MTQQPLLSVMRTSTLQPLSTTLKPLSSTQLNSIQSPIFISFTKTIQFTMPKFTIQDVLPLPHSPVKIPRIGFGVYLSPPNQCVKSCLAALNTGYRHIDTAKLYGNEEEVGEAVRQSGLKRSDVFITTKIIRPEGNIETTLESLRASVQRIGLGWVDLFLIHSPTSGPDGRREMWEALEKLKSEGGAKNIGVSNL